ncbi:putative p36 protein [Cryptosporidium felis]|nr:putative p36 protein [Cryptosporidium felis]
MLSLQQKKFINWFAKFKESNNVEFRDFSSISKVYHHFVEFISNDLGIRTIASDFDLTMMKRHSGGYIDPLDKEGMIFSKSLSPEFNVLGYLATGANISINVVTFSDPKLIPPNKRNRCISGKEMIDYCLKESHSKFPIKNCYCYYPKLWKDSQSFSFLGLKGPMPLFKTYHLMKVMEMEKLLPSQILFIDDDINNCKQALKEGFVVLHVSGNSGFSLSSADANF